MYEDMTKVLQPMRMNNYSLEYFKISNIDDSIDLGIPVNKKYIKLIDNSKIENKCIMSNVPMEEYTNEAFIKEAKGDVLIGGLGMGFVVLPLMKKESVTSITIIEKYKDIIDMITNQIDFNDKVSIINDDIFTYNPINKKYDCIYVDIWNVINRDIYTSQMIPLKNKYKPYLKNQNNNVMCWAEKQAKNNERLW